MGLRRMWIQSVVVVVVVGGLNAHEQLEHIEQRGAVVDRVAVVVPMTTSRTFNKTPLVVTWTPKSM